MEDWGKLFESCHKMLLVMASLNVAEYTRCLMLHLNVVTQHQQQETAVHEMFESNPGAMNEEGGEICFSVLARASVADTQKMKFEHMNKLYKLLHVYREITEELNDDLNGPLEEKKYSTGRFIINPESQEVLETISYFRGVIRNILAGAHTAYDGTLQGYQSKATALLHQVPQEPDKSQDLILNREKTLNHIHAQKLWLEKKFQEFWVANHADVWPSAAFEHEEHDSDVTLTPESVTDEVGTDIEEPMLREEEDLHQREEDSSSDDDRPLVRGGQVNRNHKSPAMIQKKVRAKRKRKQSVISDEEAPESPIRMEPLDDQDEIPEGEALYVEKIVSSKVKNGRTWYRVRWEGYKPEHDTFESFADLKKSMGTKKVREFIKAMNEELTDDEDIAE
jgi:hypothetical protein